MTDSLLIAKTTATQGSHDCCLVPAMATRHGLIAGATGTGKTVTLQVMAERFSQIGVPVFMADIKGDLSGISQPGSDKPKIRDRIQQLELLDFQFASCPVEFWDVFGEQGHPLRTTISEMGPLLLARLLNLNETQAGVLTIAFKIADDLGLLLLDLKDLRSLLQFVGDKAKDFKTEYGNLSAASVGAIQRGLLTLEQQGGDRFFGEPALDLMDLLQTDANGHGVINLLAANQLIQAPKLYATFVLWLLSELFEQLPEVGDMDKPKLVFFFDEAHLLFADASSALQDKLEQVVRLIRSKGVGIYFCTQNPTDVPLKVLGQLGNRLQHALRAFTPLDQKAVKAAATTFRPNPSLNVEQVITALGIGEVLVSFLDAQGIPTIVERAFVLPPQSQVGAIDPQQRQQSVQGSVLYGHYEAAEDRESAYELLKAKAAAAAQSVAQAAAQADAEKLAEQERKQAEKEATQAQKLAEKAAAAQAKEEARLAREREKFLLNLAGNAAQALGGGSQGKSIVRGVLGGILGSRRR
ncbi:helicase HerA-like domain-containing protein [Stenomitos frigidus]|uniref:ATP-binding protein n=1 Tax=Stenomitos frigidus ULC18 TaxID=2107698 RepID=A0A2T1DW36_9CYAN|nr:helicase HerA-like domain-containing protein [Stenomitos frigidus]PSB24594.1 ATP-binding protein [Stenomitos frigidus ULC18]